jgi:hypothetical protein
MLARVRNEYGRRGTVAVPRPSIAAATSTFNGTYMRPNLANGGSVPATGTMCESPDIWIAGTTPVANFQTALAATASYATQSSSNIYTGGPGGGPSNYIYVRGTNGATTTQSNTVQLYYSPNGVIQWPSQWQNNTIPTDQGTNVANINNLAPGQVGVADATFLWSNVQPPPAGSDHYCLFAQLNNATNSNPFPQVYTQLDMAALIANNLGWGWRNTVEVASNVPTWSYNMTLTIPENIPTTATYFVYVNPTGFIGWNVAFKCSETDANGNPIQLLSTAIQQNGQLAGTNCVLEPGFNAVVTIEMYSNNVASSPGATIPLGCSYQTTTTEADLAINSGLVDWGLMRLMSYYGIGIGPTPWVPLGSQSYTIAPTTPNNVRRHRQEIAR